MRKRKLIVIGLVAVMTLLSFAGCNLNSDNNIIDKLVGLKNDEMFKVNELICTTPEYMLALMNTENRYKEDLGGTVDWNTKVDSSTTLREFVLEKVKEEISLKYALAAMAADNNVTLTSDESIKITEAASQYYKTLTNEEKEYTGAGQADVEKFYTNYYLADKLYSELTKDIATKISDEEARVIRIQYIRMNTSKTKEEKIRTSLETVIDLVNGGYQEFSHEARQYSEDESNEKVIKKNEAVKKYETEAFNLGDNELSSIIQDGNDFYLVCCKESYMKEETESNKQNIITQTKKDYFDEQYKKFLDDAETDFNKKANKKISLSDDENVKNATLITTYNTIKGAVGK